MCEPMSLIGFAISAASTMASFAAEQQAADEQNRLYEQNKRNAHAAFQNKQVMMNQRITQEKEAAAAQTFDNSLEARRARATNTVAAGENGVDGNSIDALQRDIFAKEQRFNDRVNQNTDWTVQQLQAEKKGQSYEALDRINSVRQADNPSFAGAMLKIASGGINAFSTQKK